VSTCTSATAFHKPQHWDWTRDCSSNASSETNVTRGIDYVPTARGTGRPCLVVMGRACWTVVQFCDISAIFPVILNVMIDRNDQISFEILQHFINRIYSLCIQHFCGTCTRNASILLRRRVNPKSQPDEADEDVLVFSSWLACQWACPKLLNTEESSEPVSTSVSASFHLQRVKDNGFVCSSSLGIWCKILKF